jgi:hypothetical protein
MTKHRLTHFSLGVGALGLALALLLATSCIPELDPSAGGGQGEGQGEGEGQSESALTSNGVTATLRLASDWGSGYCADIVVTNGSSATVSSWSVRVTLNQSTASAPWNGTASGSSGTITVNPLDWNRSLAPRATATVGFCGSATGSNYRPVLASLSVTGGGATTGGTTPPPSGTGGSTGTGGTTGSGGSGGGSSTGTGGTPSTGTGGSAGTGGTTVTTAGCPNPGNGGVLNSTVVVRSGQTYDGGCKRFTAGSSLGDGSQSESQSPMFRLESGAKLVNVVLGAPAADGIHTYGNVALENVTWQDVGEDALTIKASGTVTLNGGSATAADDKIFQVNAASTFRISNFRASNAGKMIRQNGGTTYKVAIFIDRCDISNMRESIFRTDSSSSTVSMTNTRYSRIGSTLFMGVSSTNITTSNNTQY